MIEWIKDKLILYGWSAVAADYVAAIAAIVVVVLLSMLAYLIAKLLLLRVLREFIARSRVKWDDKILRRGVLERLCLIVPAIVLHVMAPVFGAGEVWVRRIAFCIIVLGVVLALDRLLSAVDDIYRGFEVSKSRPIKGYLQIVKILAYIVGGVVIISALTDRSPLLLLSGIGAATAVLLLIFQNSILGFVASIQLTENDMVQIGDWIEMPKYNADGDVVDITLHTVKVQNWDKTITTIPTHALVSDSFKNWRGMREIGGRRIKRSIYIDMKSIKFCDGEMLARFRKIQYIKEYLERKTEEIEAYNKQHVVDDTSLVNGRHLTNIGTFRAYAEAYLKNHPKIHKGLIHMVRQLAPGEFGLPVEIYAFTATTAWVEYEGIQADIFDHLLAVVPEFDLRIYQSPSGHDLTGIKTN